MGATPPDCAARSCTSVPGCSGARSGSCDLGHGTDARCSLFSPRETGEVPALGNRVVVRLCECVGKRLGWSSVHKRGKLGGVLPFAGVSVAGTPHRPPRVPHPRPPVPRHCSVGAQQGQSGPRPPPLPTGAGTLLCYLSHPLTYPEHAAPLP